MVLAELEPVHSDTVELGLDALPLPAVLQLASVQLDLLHTGDQLHQRLLVLPGAAKAAHIQAAPLPQEDQDIAHIERAAQHRYPEQLDVIEIEHHPKDNEVDEGEDHPQHRAGEEALHAAVVADTLEDVPHQFGVEIGDWQLH